MIYEVAEEIYWVGVYLGKEAMLSLNAFLLKDKETTLIDTGYCCNCRCNHDRHCSFRWGVHNKATAFTILPEDTEKND